MSRFRFSLQKKDINTRARAGIIHTPHGDIKTPAFSVVGTKASVKGLDIKDIKECGSQVVLANTYHLYLRPGENVINKFGGLRKFMNWEGPMITDSGGYQVSYLWSKGKANSRNVKINDKGAVFRSHIDGSIHVITPEKSMEIQKALGADIVMAFDQPLKFKDSKYKNAEAIRRTFDWEERSYITWKKLNVSGNYQALYGILHGALDKKIRKSFLDFVLELDFDGIAIGDETIGADPALTAAGMDTVSEYLPDGKPVHALGLGGGPEGIFTAVERGMDTFDNTGVTRMARTGLLYLYPEDGGNTLNKFRVDIKKKKFSDRKSPISKSCNCETCKTYSSAYVHHLVLNDEPLGVKLTTMHNVFYINDLMNKIRDSILNNDFLSLKRHWLGS